LTDGRRAANLMKRQWSGRDDRCRKHRLADYRIGLFGGPGRQEPRTLVHAFGMACRAYRSTRASFAVLFPKPRERDGGRAHLT